MQASVLITLTLPLCLAQRLHQFATEHGLSRSAAIRYLIERGLQTLTNEEGEE